MVVYSLCPNNYSRHFYLIPCRPCSIAPAAGGSGGFSTPLRVTTPTIAAVPRVESPTPVALQEYPTSLDVMYLSEEERTAPYGIGYLCPRMVSDDITKFVKWSTTAVQLDRSERYPAAVQSTTTEKQEVAIRAYLGYLINIRGHRIGNLIDLSDYSDPDFFIGFISYLVARNVGRGHILKHISLARKVNNFLGSGECHADIGAVCCK